ncbi:Suppressor of the cold-sensitive snRNP biogenesis mutant brr1-1 [Arthrobotrys musiformis]|uniref:Suppressor of the cold-sensitive snRNP biogenesis mutant brr1-1 n=1 Tax=Arthrobotrys musiformis TaxID=47236 RepID=A0AAV9VXN2_9PEZI
MRDPQNLLLFLTLLFLRISFTAAADDRKPWIFTIKKDKRADPKLGDMHKALEAGDAKPPWNWVFDSADDIFGTFFMTVNSTVEHKDKIVKDYGDLISAWADYTTHREPLYTAYASGDFEIDHDINQRHERLMMLQQENKEVPSKYYYHKSRGKGVTVYFIDTGINRNHPEFIEADDDKRLEVIFSNPFPPDPNDPGRLKIDIDSSLRFSHGSSVAGVVIGKVTGLAPNSNVVMIGALDRNAQSSEALYLNALTKLYRHIDKNSKQKPVIVNISLNAGYLPQTKDKTIEDIRAALNEVWDRLMRLDHVIVTSASGVSEWSDKDVTFSWPNVRAEDKKSSPNLVIVGGVDKEGLGIFQKPKSNYQAVYAPAYAVKITSNIGYQLTTGTSFASAFTAGVLANYLSRDPKLSAPGAVKQLLDLSHKRHKDGPPVVWTGVSIDDLGITFDDLKKDEDGNKVCKRADGAEDCTPSMRRTRTGAGKTPVVDPPPKKTPSRADPEDDTDDDVNLDDLGSGAGIDDDGSGGYPKLSGDDDDDDDDRTLVGDDEDDDPDSVNYVSTSTVIKEVKYNVYVTVGANQPSKTKGSDLEDIDPLADRGSRGRGADVEARAVAVTTQPSPAYTHPATGTGLTFQTSSPTENPLP